MRQALFKMVAAIRMLEYYDCMTCWGTLYKNGLTLILAWINNYIHEDICDGSTHPFPSLCRWTLGMDM